MPFECDLTWRCDDGIVRIYHGDAADSTTDWTVDTIDCDTFDVFVGLLRHQRPCSLRGMTLNHSGGVMLWIVRGENGCALDCLYYLNNQNLWERLTSLSNEVRAFQSQCIKPQTEGTKKK